MTFPFPVVPLCSKSFLIKFYQNWKIAIDTVARKKKNCNVPYRPPSIDVVFDLICFSFELFK